MRHLSRGLQLLTTCPIQLAQRAPFDADPLLPMAVHELLQSDALWSLGSDPPAQRQLSSGGRGCRCVCVCVYIEPEFLGFMGWKLSSIETSPFFAAHAVLPCVKAASLPIWSPALGHLAETVKGDLFPASCRNTVDGRNPAPPTKLWNDESPVNTNKQWFPRVSKWCWISSIHRITESSSQLTREQQQRKNKTHC